jgi:septum formation protein
MFKYKILLASGSPRRSFLLKELDLPHRIVISDVEEIVPDDMHYTQVPEYLARLKGNACLKQLKKNEILVAADTVVIHQNEILGKPKNQSDAAIILQRLSGEKHEVISGVFLTDGKTHKSFSVETGVLFDQMTSQEIDYYVKNYSPMDKAGSYGIQEWVGWAKIKRIEGSYSNIMGLPTQELYRALESYGLN